MVRSSEARLIEAAVLRRSGGAFSIERLSLEAPRDDEVLVRIEGAGVCHTDAAVRSGEIPFSLPAVLGHEGSGVVEAVGAGVTLVKPGDHVVLTFRSCGACVGCRDGHPSACETIMPLNFAGARPDGSHAIAGGTGVIHDRFFAQSSFASHALAAERNVVVVARDVPIERLGPLGCGVQTGAGAVLNAFKVQSGESLVVFGAGGVGLSAVMAARVVGAAIIVAVDIVRARLDLALELGATDVIDSSREDVLARLETILPRGSSFSLDTTGRVEVIQLAIKTLGNRGTCGILGASPPGRLAALDPHDVISRSKRIVGIMGGDSDPAMFIPKLVALHRAGKLPFDRMIRFYPLDRIDEAFDDAHHGRVVKPVIRIAHDRAAAH